MNLEIITKSDSLNIQNEIISQIKELINFKNLEPGDKLPSERMLAEKLGVSRGQIREAIQKLEFYGILNSKPQSGTFVANIGVTAMNGMIEDILNLEEPDFKSLVETRILLELKTVRLAAIRRTEEDLKMMHDALQAYSLKVINGEDAVQEDLLFHLAIAKACGNSTMNTFMLIITPEIITNFEKHHVCNDVDKKIGIKEHQAVYDAIVAQDPQLAKMKMKEHFKELYQYCYNI
ncbi:FadR/GntR family transcriptional regulator [Croceibacter atlanticus]|jgi:GntR family transcriptional repressor for pyruvate dehydrogenase complex|uniref:Transcriptional regulator, GntR family protein n=1 Tax=Croceibacter atlanticus (strain ATCC BAA-628 / JCM 21780 / CIP 108009 / IAM 15332 / KCTC 12090 / HTCC2559) TaxID=216432 RepID=A3UA18_CROAH|nr:FadR/GntR family transcriptional regulator [Croceibacter atlanticus]EAP86654.1 transcriptional regulator, GntR family protein [Croceibacter atlanticus HTCC2559]